jgi:hypothetical protein
MTLSNEIRVHPLLAGAFQASLSGGCQDFDHTGQQYEICTDVSFRRKPSAHQPAMNSRKVHKGKGATE